MRVTYNWLKDFVDIQLPAQVLAEKLTMAGLEVTSLGQKDGDFVFEIEITSNRPDWLSVIGIAREIAAITNSKLKTQNSKLLSAIPYPLSAKGLQIRVANNKDCPLYTAKIIRGVKVGNSPDWLKKRLELIGCRSINNIVDITNYVLFETGQPLHAFDLDKIGQGIVVRRARSGEKIVTIDGAGRVLTEDMVIIASGDDKISNPIAIAGVIGGKDTEVTEKTQNILLEAAVFNPVVVRRARQELGISTESSYRFERAVDISNTASVSLNAASTITSISGGEVSGSRSTRPVKEKISVVSLDISGVAKVLGTSIPVSSVRKILSALGFKIKQQGKNMLKVGIPGYRSDIHIEADLLEEVSRVYGYTKISSSLPAIRPQGITVSDTRSLISQIKNILIGLGLDEVITHNLISRVLLRDLYCDNDFSVVDIKNPLSREQEILRPTIIPSLIKIIGHNLNQKQEDIRIFEIAKVFSMSSGKPKEEQSIGIALCAQSTQEGILGIKGILENLFVRLGIKGFRFGKPVMQQDVEVYIGQEKVARIKDTDNGVLDKAGIKNKKVVTAEAILDKILAHAFFKKRFEPLPLYPAISRDISLILRDEIMSDEVLEAIKEKGEEFLREARIVDYYKGRQIPDGFKGLTISCLYRSSERTLTEPEVTPVHNAICSLLADRFSAKIR